MGLRVQPGQQPELLSKKLESVDEAEVLHRWFKVERIPCVISSPFRDDKTPSFHLRYNSNGHIYGHDYATGEHYSVTDMVMKAENVDFKTAVSMILNGQYGNFVTTVSIQPRPAVMSKIDVVVREWNDNDIAFWSSFGITKEWLEFGDVYPISGIVFTTDGYRRDMAAEQYAYAYVTFFKGKRHIKVYQPFSKTRKWQNDGDGVTQVWNLIKQLPATGDSVIITSSVKDALCIWANTGVPACCPQSESTNLNEGIVENLKKRFKRVFVWFDNDFTNPKNPGQAGAKKACDKFGLENIMIDAWWGCKDPSDLYKTHGAYPLIRTLQKHNLCTNITTNHQTRK